MTAKTMRFLKEARPLFWPWCAVVLAGALPLAHPPNSLGWITRMGFFLGIPMLASLPLGNEFHQRTISLLLSQPIDRMKIWREKLSVTGVAAVSALLVFALAWRGPKFQSGPQSLAFAGAFFVATTASATFWTLFTRSTLGGIVLNIAAQFFIFALNAEYWYRRTRFLSPEDGAHVWDVTFISLAYAGVMFWLGWRMLAHFQTTGGVAGGDLLIAGQDAMPGALAGLLRCRPAGVVLNLIRKEIRLLWPVCLFTILAAIGWTWVTAVSLLHHGVATRNFQTTVASVGVTCALLVAVLAGTVSLGEERISGTHGWHLTLPAPVLLQWAVKLGMALGAGVAGAWLLPNWITGRSLFASRANFEIFVLHSQWGLIVVLLLTFAAFWCACAVNGTVRAVLGVFPMLFALYLAAEFGRWAGPVLTQLFFSRFDPFANLSVANAVSSMFEPIATSRFAVWEFFYNRGYIALMVWAILVPTLFLAVIQSYRLFRAPLQDSALSFVRNLLPLALVAFLCSFSFMAFFSSAVRARNGKSTALIEIFHAIEKIGSGALKLDAAHPLQLTVEDLAKAFRLSKSTRRVLGNSPITVRLEAPPHQGHFGCPENPEPRGLPALAYAWYSANGTFTDGSHFFVAFDPVTHSTISAGFCK